jgi:hypothetical protein
LVAGKAAKQAHSGATQLFGQRRQRAKESAQDDAVNVYSFLIQDFGKTPRFAHLCTTNFTFLESIFRTLFTLYSHKT